MYWQFQSFPLAFVHVTPCRFQLDFLSIFQYDNQWTSDGPLWQLHEVRSACSACISTQRHGHEKRLLRTIFGGEKVSETSCMFGIEIPGVVAVTVAVLTVLPLRRRLPVLAVSSILFYFNQYRQDKVQISRNWPGVAAWHGIYCSSCNDSTHTSMENKEYLVDQSDMATSVVNVQESSTSSVGPSW